MTATPNPAEVAARVLEIGELATGGTWDVVERDGGLGFDVVRLTGHADNEYVDLPQPMLRGMLGERIDAELIAYYRTAAPLLARALLEAEQREMALVVARRAWPIGALVTIPMLDAIDAIVAAHDARTGETP